MGHYNIDPEKQRKHALEWIGLRRAEIARKPGQGALGKAMDRETVLFLETHERRALGHPVPQDLTDALIAASAVRASLYPVRNG